MTRITGAPVAADEVADLALRLIRVPSLSGREDGAARVVQEAMGRLGFAVEVDDWGNVTGSIGSLSGPCVLFDGHMDTVGVGTPSAWTSDPVGVRVGSRLYGRGAMDMKGPLAAAIFGAAALRDRLQQGRVVVSASVAEELVEGPALVHVAERVRPDYVVICEATSLRLARGQRGRAEVKLEISGRSAHSSRPDLSVNAAQAMADAVLALRDLSPPRHEMLGDGILVLTDIKSEPYPGLSVVPDRCLATYDRRTLPGESEEMILRPIRDAAQRAAALSGAQASVAIARDDFETYTGARVVASNFAPAWFFDEKAGIVVEAAAGLADAGLPVALSHYAFCTNGSGTAGRLGIPTVGFGPGDEALAHRVDEYVEVEDLVLAARGYGAIAARLTGWEG